MERTVAVELSDDERQMLVEGLVEWGGPAYGSDALAIAMGFSSLEDLYEEAQRISYDIHRRRPMSTMDWTRALVATEIAFASYVLGAGIIEWTAIRGCSDAEAVGILTRLQHKVPTDRHQLPA